MPSRFPLVARAGSVIWQFVLLLTCVVPLLCAHAEAPTLRIFGWGDYIDQRALDKFTGETGIQVQYDIYNSLSELEATVALARSGYDIIMPTNEPTLSRLVRGDRLARIDRVKVPNWKNLDPALMRMVATADPGNKHGAIYLWGTLGLGMLPDKVRALVPDVPLDSLDLLFKPENAQRLQSCGITILDSPPEVIPTVLHYLGLSPSSTSATDLAAAHPYGHPSIHPDILRDERFGDARQWQHMPGAGLFWQCPAGRGSGQSGEPRRECSLLCPEGRGTGFVRRAGDSHRRAKQGCRHCVHQFHAATRDHCRHQQRDALCERCPSKPSDDRPGTAE
jgi:hypothetical protein